MTAACNAAAKLVALGVLLAAEAAIDLGLRGLPFNQPTTTCLGYEGETMLANGNIYTVYDIKAQVFMNPMFTFNHEAAIRTFTDCVNQQDHAFYQHPEDYQLFFLGTYDQDTGKITPVGPEHIADGHFVVSRDSATE